MFVAVSFAGAIVCFMVWLTIMRAFAKLDILFQIIYRSLPDHPMSVMDEETKKSGKRLFRVNPIIAYWVPAFCVLSLIAGGVASLVGAF